MNEKMNFALSDEDVASMPIDEQVVHCARKVQANNPALPYIEAQALALAANPKLAKAYADSNGVRNPDGGVDRPSYRQE